MSNQVIKAIEKHFGSALPRRDIKKDVSFVVLPCDLKGATSSPFNCAGVHAWDRTTGKLGFKSMWLDTAVHFETLDEKGEKFVGRGILSKKARRIPAEFDARKRLVHPAGLFVTLKPPPLCDTLKESRKRKKKYNASEAGRVHYEVGKAIRNHRTAVAVHEKVQEKFQKAERDRAPTLDLRKSLKVAKDNLRERTYVLRQVNAKAASIRKTTGKPRGIGVKGRQKILSELRVV